MILVTSRAEKGTALQTSFTRIHGDVQGVSSNFTKVGYIAVRIEIETLNRVE